MGNIGMSQKYTNLKSVLTAKYIIRRLIATNFERSKQINDPMHPKYGQTAIIYGLKSRKGFLIGKGFLIERVKWAEG